MANYQTILFDLDGTLTDPKQGITKSVQYALGKFDIPVEDLDELDKFIGPPLKKSFMVYYSFSEDQALKAIDFYREYFKDRGLYENKVYGGIPELLSELQSQGRTLAVATSKPTFFAEQIIDHFGLSDYLTAVAGSNLDNTGTDKKDVIAHALSMLNCAHDTAVMIGDRKHDLIGARKNGLDSIGVLYGYGGEGELEAEAPRHIARDVKALSAILL